MEEQQNTLKMKVDQKTVFILITVLSFFFHFLLICLSKIISAFNITMRVFSLQSKKYLQHKTDKPDFYFQHRFASTPVSFRLLCFVAQNKNKDPEERQL